MKTKEEREAEERAEKLERDQLRTIHEYLSTHQTARKALYDAIQSGKTSIRLNLAVGNPSTEG